MIDFTGHHDPEAHLEMLRAYDRWDSILMPLNVSDPLCLSKDHDPSTELGSRGVVGSVVSHLAPRQEGTCTWRQSRRSLGMSATMVRTSASVSSPLKARLTFTFCSFHIRTVTSASLAIS
jgi:hypothetical protein